MVVIRIWLLSSFALGIVLTIDQLRRPRAAWEAAGRERRFWVALTLASGFHGLGPFASVAYLTAVVPRFRSAGGAASPRAPVHWLGSAVAVRRRQRTAAEALALVAAILVFASSFIHAAVVVSHLEYYAPSGVFFLVVTCAQAGWAALVYRDPRNRRVLRAGIAGNGALIVLWAISRTVGLPIGPDPWTPEAVGAADVLSKVDEVAAIVLLGIVLSAAESSRVALTRIHARLVTALAGPLFLYSVLGALGAKHHH